MKIMKCLKIIVKGRVQGVGFRYFIQQQASLLGIKGYVRNSINGNVEIIASSEENNLIEFLHQVQKGPSFARVDDLTISEITRNADYEKFIIKY